MRRNHPKFGHNGHGRAVTGTNREESDMMVGIIANVVHYARTNQNTAFTPQMVAEWYKSPNIDAYDETMHYLAQIGETIRFTENGTFRTIYTDDDFRRMADEIIANNTDGR
jgi:hypothetical protein